MFLWIDHAPAPANWLHVPSAWRAIDMLQSGLVEKISINDHLGHPEVTGTGRDVLLWIHGAMTQGFKPPQISVHCAKPSQRQHLMDAVRHIENLHFRHQS